MPTYQYECQTCQVFFEVKRSFKEVNQEVRCLACEGTNTRRIVTGGQAIFFAIDLAEAGENELRQSDSKFVASMVKHGFNCLCCNPISLDTPSAKALAKRQDK